MYPCPGHHVNGHVRTLLRCEHSEKRDETMLSRESSGVLLSSLI